MLLLAAGLVGTWIYHLYDKTQYTNRKTKLFIIDSTAVANAIKDSLQLFYTGTIQNLDAQLDSAKTNADSIRFDLDNKLGEINNLKSEISSILKNRNASRTDLTTARDKIDELQLKVNELKDQNFSMEEEKVKLSTAYDHLSSEMKNLEQNIRRLNKENSEMSEKINVASTFIVSELKLSAVNVRGNKELEAKEAAKTDKFVISFTLQNNITDYVNTEIIFILTDASGQVIQNPVWDSGKFTSKKDEVKSFTRKMRFDYSKGEQKKLTFSLEADKYEKGNYKMQIYHNGLLIGATSKTLK